MKLFYSYKNVFKEKLEIDTIGIFGLKFIWN